VKDILKTFQKDFAALSSGLTMSLNEKHMAIN